MRARSANLHSTQHAQATHPSTHTHPSLASIRFGSSGWASHATDGARVLRIGRSGHHTIIAPLIDDRSDHPPTLYSAHNTGKSTARRIALIAAQHTTADCLAAGGTDRSRRVGAGGADRWTGPSHFGRRERGGGQASFLPSSPSLQQPLGARGGHTGAIGAKGAPSILLLSSSFFMKRDLCGPAAPCAPEAGGGGGPLASSSHHPELRCCSSAPVLCWGPAGRRRHAACASSALVASIDGDVEHRRIERCAPAATLLGSCE